MKQTELSPSILREGGEIFKDEQGNPRTQRIALKDIAATLVFLEKVSGLPVKDYTLGSVGKKQSSGDLDIAVDSNKISKDELTARLSKYAQEQGADPKTYTRKSGISVHFLTPIRGNPSLGFVQTDFMFDADPEWMKFGMYSAGDASKYSGADRNLLMSSVAKAKGMKYSWQKGLIRREDESPISKDPDVIAKKLFGNRYTGEVFDSVEQMQEAIGANVQLQGAFKLLIAELAKSENPDGSARKPSEMRKNQEEIARIQRLTGL
jgi:hypothetical protein